MFSVLKMVLFVSCANPALRPFDSHFKARRAFVKHRAHYVLMQVPLCFLIGGSSVWNTPPHDQKYPLRCFHTRHPTYTSTPAHHATLNTSLI